MTITKVQSPDQIAAVANLAREIWTEHYAPIIGLAQVDYMLATFQSEQAIAGQIAGGYAYYLVTHDGREVSYLALLANTDETTLMISKIYVTQAGRGGGFGRKLLDFAEDVCRARQIPTLWLTVNKDNAGSIAWYTRMGFKNAGAIVQDIGAGFVMGDYRMEKMIGSHAPGV
ncbi:GNAT family N-acetyltransferase [Zoogloeaceae bacterium G21618-S1]|nr:GNAT family N-acetyltransferase [Zoogloeaceae bacterium G21618-S1]